MCLDVVERMVGVHGKERYETVECFGKTVPRLFEVVGKGKGASKDLKGR